MEKLNLKGKLQGFIADSRQKLLSSNSGNEPDSLQDAISSVPQGCLAARTMWTDSDREVSQLASDPVMETEVLGELEEEYFQENWDSSTHWITKLGENVSDLETIDKARKDLMSQLTTVSRRVFSLILAKQADCATQLSHIVRVEARLQEALGTCQGARAGLGRAQRQFVESSLGILASVRRRQRTRLMLDHLTQIHNTARTMERADQLARCEDWPGAITLYLECQKTAAKFQQFSAVEQLSSRLGDSLVMVEEILDSALAKQCNHFLPEIYSKLQVLRHSIPYHKKTGLFPVTRPSLCLIFGRLGIPLDIPKTKISMNDFFQDSYSILGKCQTATDQLLMHFTTAMHNTSWQVVYGHVCLMQELSRPPPYQELCGLVHSESFLPCLTDLLKALWAILFSYHSLYSWHKAHWTAEEVSSESVSASYNKNKLQNGLFRIWQDVQSKVKQLVLGSDLSQFSIDSFLHFLDLIHKLIMVGQEFLLVSGEKDLNGGASALQESLIQQCSNYFSSYHSSRLEELATHLDNESWTLIPVKQNFNLHLLAEFSHMAILKSPSKSVNANIIFKKYASNNVTPFDILSLKEEEEDILQGGTNISVVDSDSDDDLSEEQKRQLFEENNMTSYQGLTSLSGSQNNTTKPSPRPPVTGVTVSNTGLMVLRLIGRYSHMMTVLRPISQQVWTGICQLFQYYLYSVHLMFTSENTSDTGPDSLIYTDQASQLLSFIYNTLVLHEIRDGEVSRLVGSVREPRLAPCVSIGRKETLFGLTKRIVAMESVRFLSDELTRLQDHYKHQLQGNNEVGVFYESCINACQDLRPPIYIGAIKNILHTEVIRKMMANVSWDLRDVVSQHSHYVDEFLNKLESFSKEMARVATEVPISKHLQIKLWEITMLVCCQTFVDGFSAVKKCTNEGRALMQLDFRQFVLKLEKLSGVKPLPHQQFVSAYIKAYYIPESELGAWVEQHAEYSAPQLRALVAITTTSNNKTKQKLNSLINDLSERIRR